MSNTTFRPAVLADLPILYEFEQGIVHAERPFDPTLKAGHINYYDLKELVESNGSQVIVAICEDEIVGSAYVLIQKAKPYLSHEYFAYVGFMFVKAAYRGKGISQQIIDELKSWARSKNLTEMRLDVYDENTPAVKAYEKVGFKKHLVEMRLEIES
jgi:GNAT superfamily N-acetyltransferase